MQFFGDHQRRSASSKGIEDGFTRLGARPDDSAEQLFGHLAPVPAGPFLERPAHARDVPDILVGGEACRRILRAENPRVVRKPPLGMCTRIGIDELPCRRNPNGIRVEREEPGVFDEVEQMRVTAAEFLFAVHAERVIPDHPTAAEQPQFTLEEQLQFGGEVIANRQPERAGRFKRVYQRLAPLPGPGEVLVRRQTIFVHVVGVADIEWWIRKGQINRPRSNGGHPGDAVGVIEFIQLRRSPFPVAHGAQINLSAMAASTSPRPSDSGGIFPLGNGGSGRPRFLGRAGRNSKKRPPPSGD